MADANSSADLSDYMDKMISSQDTNALWAIYAEAMTALGFDKLIYGGTRLPQGARLGDIRDAMILHHGPQGYADAYIGEELYLSSPTYEWAVHNSGFASWADAVQQFKSSPTPEQMRILQLNAEYGLFAGYVGALSDVVRGMHGVIGISPVGSIDQAATDELWTKVGKQVETLSNLLHLRIASLPFVIQRRPLTSRQKEALHWFAQGKTMQDIATIMGLSSATIEKHLRMARDSLDAQTTAHAVQKATSLNLLVA
jgi:LuxR family transcriptional regulator